MSKLTPSYFGDGLSVKKLCGVFCAHCGKCSVKRSPSFGQPFGSIFGLSLLSQIGRYDAQKAPNMEFWHWIS